MWVNRLPAARFASSRCHPWRTSWLALSTGTIPLIGKLPHTLCLLSTSRRKNLANLTNLTPATQPTLQNFLFSQVRASFRPDPLRREPSQGFVTRK